jgi:hypothetical protein
MKASRVVGFVILLFASFEAFCQAATEVEMADVLRKDGKIYTVVAGVIVILTAMVILLIRVDRKLFRLERQKKEGA